MSKAQPVTGEVPADYHADLLRLAELWSLPVDHLVATAVIRFVAEESRVLYKDEFAHLPPYVDASPTARALDEAQARAREALEAYIGEGTDAIECGDVISHEDLMAELRSRYGKKQAA